MSLLPKPYSSVQSIANYEDPNKTCTWLFSTDKFSSVDVGEDRYYSFAEAQQTCVELGKNKCNAVVGDASHCGRKKEGLQTLVAGQCRAPVLLTY